MSTFFNEALTDLNRLEEEILGPDYPYYKYINSPSEMGMGAGGDKIATNIGGLLAYTNLLVTGKGKASTTGNPLGNKFFMKTGAQCKDVDTGELVTRSLYINNVPDGTIPLMSSMTGASFSTFKGLVPGILSDMNELNPLKIFQAFMLGNEPECKQQTMEVINTNNVSSKDTQYIALADIKSMNPCWFDNRKNPITNATCKEAFSKIEKGKMPQDIVIQIYYSSLGLIGLYILMKLVTMK